MGTHPIFESDFDCLTESNDMILRRRGGSLRVVVGTSIFWILVFFSSSDWWCKTKHLHLKNAEDLKPAKEQWSDVINDGLQKGFDGKKPKNPNLEQLKPADEKIAKMGRFNPKVDLQKSKPGAKSTPPKKKSPKTVAGVVSKNGPGEMGAAVKIPK